MNFPEQNTDKREKKKKVRKTSVTIQEEVFSLSRLFTDVEFLNLTYSASLFQDIITTQQSSHR